VSSVGSFFSSANIFEPRLKTELKLMNVLSFLEVFNSIYKCSFYKCSTDLLHDFYALYLDVHSEANKVLVGYTG